MIIATWVLLAVLSCFCQALTSPVTVALESSTHDELPNDDTVAVPDKRILKYFLPSAQAWSTNGVVTGPEGNKRGYGDRNFLRFGRSGDAIKKNTGRNFLRFGRAGNEEFEQDEDPSASVDKRDRNFLRFGRDRNFLRFGRSGSQGVQDFEDEGSPVEEGRTDLENYLRYARTDRNFLRFGRNFDKNFLRFGRSVDEEDLNKHSESASSSSPVPGDHDTETSPSADTKFPANEKKALRPKRQASPYYESSVWGRNPQPSDEDDERFSLDDLQEVAKRAYSRDFLRFGRDRNFLRFGKRFDSPDSDMMLMSPLQYTSKRGSHNNFLRFG